MRRRDDIDPGGDVHLLMAQDLAHAVVEDFGGGAWNRSEPGVAQHRDIFGIFHPRATRPVHYFHRRESVDMNLREAGLHRDEQVAILERRHIGVDAALHANLGGAARDGIGHFRENRLVGMVVGVGFPLLPLEAAKLASDETDIGEVDVPIDDVGHFVANIFGAREIGALDNCA